MLYQFKQQPEDFIVEEILPEYPNGKGEVFYVFFEKKNLTTMEVLEHLQHSLNLFREDFGIAGLKDKAGITRQWITIFKSRLERVGGEVRFLSVLAEIVKVLETSRGEEPLRVGSNMGNKFKVRLRASSSFGTKGKISSHLLDSSPRIYYGVQNDEWEEKKNLIAENIEKLKVKGFPNCFGSQRFGKRNKNFWEAKRVMEAGLPRHSASLHSSQGHRDVEGSYHLRFMLQAYASMYFNEYVMNRREKGQFILGGDIVVDRYFAKGARVGVYENGGVSEFDYVRLKEENEGVAVFSFSGLPHRSVLFHSSQGQGERISTGPMLGWNLLLAPEGSKARVRDDLLLKLAEFDEQALEVCKFYQLRGIRRPLWVYVKDLEWRFDGEDVLLEFSLPTGSYATVLLAFVLQGVDVSTLRDKRLEIPRIEQ